MSSTYYDSGDKLVIDGDTAKADDLNNVNIATDTGFQRVDTDVVNLKALTSTAVPLSRNWATANPGTEPDHAQHPDEYSSKAYSEEAKSWAIEPNVTDWAGGGVIHTADGTYNGTNDPLVPSEPSAKASAEEAKGEVAKAQAEVVLAKAEVVNAQSEVAKAQEWAEKPEDSPVEPGEFSALHWAAKAEEHAEVAIGTNEIKAGENIDVAKASLGGTPEVFEYTVSAPSMYRKNFIKNGCMRVAQRGVLWDKILRVQHYTREEYRIDQYFSCATVVPDPPYSNKQTVDFRVEQVDGLTESSTGFGLLQSVTRRKTEVTNVKSFSIANAIESIDARSLKGKTVTVSFNVKSTSGTLPLIASIERPTATDNYASTASIHDSPFTATTTNQVVSFTVALGATDTTKGIRFKLRSSSRIVLATNGATKGFIISDLQLEIGSKATPFEYRPYSEELAMCQRYFINMANQSSIICIPFGYASEAIWQLNPEMRANPTVDVGTTSDGTITASQARPNMVWFVSIVATADRTTYLENGSASAEIK